MKIRISKLNAAILLSAALVSTAIAAPKPGEYGDSTFTASLDLYSAIQVSTLQNLRFGHVVAGVPSDVNITAASPSAAVFSATGDNNASVVGSVTSSSIDMTNGGTGANNTIRVDTWAFGGDMDATGRTTFSSTGTLSDLRVGAIAHVTATNLPGDYTGTATFRLTYL